MKKLNKIMALMVAAIMCIGILSVSAFAAGEGTITIKNSELNTEYQFFRVLALTGKDTSEPADTTYDVVAYTIDDDWANFFKGEAAGASYLIAAADATAEQKATLNQINFDGSVVYLNLTDDNVVAFTNSAMEYAITQNMSPDETADGTGEDVDVENLDLGYWLMIPVDASIKTPNSSGSVASITSTIPTADILVKAVKPSIEKTDDVITADIGQTVTYTLTGEVPNTAGYETYKYIICDKMSTGLTFNEDVAITITHEGTDIDITEDTDVDIDYDDSDYENGFTADIPVKNYQDYIGDTITLVYTATVNDDAVTVPQATNEAHLEYGHDPDELETTTPIKEEVYSAKIIVNKYTGDDPADNDAKLADASFALMNNEGKYYKYTAATETEPAKVEWVTITGAPTDGTAAVTDAMAKALADNVSSFTPKTTDGTGAAEFPGIKDGTYYLVEFAAPDGYNRLDKPYEVTVAGTNADTAEGQVENHADSTENFDSANNATADIKNNTGSVLPTTGGIGTRVFYIAGAIIVIAAGVTLFVRKRVGQEK